MEKEISVDLRESLTDKIYHDLLAKLQESELVPGMLIDRKALAAEYHVSMAPVRDALQRLSLEGFVETRSRSATVVKAIHKDDVFGTMVLREALETQVVRMISGDIIRAEKDVLYELAMKVDSCNSIMEYWKADINFHRQLVLLSNCRLLIDTYDQIMNLGTFYQVNKFFFRLDTSQCESHIQLLRRLLACDPAEAEAAIRQHLSNGKSLAAMRTAEI